MCFNASLTKKQRDLSVEFDIPQDSIPDFFPYHHASAFAHPDFPLLCSDSPGKIVLGRWGLRPHWARSVDKAIDIRNKTLNARSETAEKLPSFRDAFKNRTCLIIIDGFYEPHRLENTSYPFLIRYPDMRPFTLAGLYSDWHNPETDKTYRTFTVLTTTAEGMLKAVHNVKERMPVILDKNQRKHWISGELSEQEKKALLAQGRMEGLEAFPVSRSVLNTRKDSNKPESQERQHYPELASSELSDVPGIVL